MRAVGYYPSTTGGAPEFQDLELPKPTPGPWDLLVAVRAAAMNPVDIKVGRLPGLPADGARVLGFDASGVVEAVGANVSLFKPGDEVFYAGNRNRQGSNAEFQLVDERCAGRKPKSLSHAEAAALPLTALTAWELLFDRLRVNAGETASILVVNGAGGVGSILIQLARILTRLDVTATASRPESRDWCLGMGAHRVVDHSRPLDAVLAEAGVGQVKYVAGLTATEKHLPAILEVIAPQGSLAIIDDVSALDTVKLKQKSLTVVWEYMFTRALFQTHDLPRQHDILERVADLVDAGKLATTMTRNLGPMSAASIREAHALSGSGRTIGKIVLEEMATGVG